MALSSYILPISVTSSIVRISPSSKWVLVESSRGFGSALKLNTPPLHGCNRRFDSVLVRNSILPDETPVPSGGSWKGWIFGMLLTIVFPMWRNKIGPFALLKNKLDTVVQTAEDIAEAVEQVAEQVDKLADEVTEHLPEGGRFRHAVEVIDYYAEETAKKAHLLGEVIDKVQEVEEDLEELIDHPAMSFSGGAKVVEEATTIAASAPATLAEEATAVSALTAEVAEEATAIHEGEEKDDSQESSRVENSSSL